MNRTKLAAGALCLSLVVGCGDVGGGGPDASGDAGPDTRGDSRDVNPSSDTPDSGDANGSGDVPISGDTDADAGASDASDAAASVDADADGAAVEAPPSLWPSEIPVGRAPKTPLPAGDPICYPSGWCWENPLPLGGNMAVWAVAADDVWAVGSHGIARHFDGQSWTNVPTPTTVRLDAVWGLATDAVWAVGNHVLLRWNGASWVQVDNGNRGGDSLSGLGPNDLWIGSPYTGLLHHYDGQRWTDANFGQAVFDVYETADATVFAALQSTNAFDGDLYEIAASIPGGGRPVQSTIGRKPESGVWGTGVWGTSLTDVWLVNQTNILRFDDKTWRASLTLPDVAGSPHFRGIHGSSASNVWVSALDGSMLHWNGASYERWPSGVSLPDHVCARTTNDVWTAGPSGALSHFDGTAWQRHGSGIQMKQLHALGPVGDEVWAVGNNLTGPQVLRGAPGGPWQEIPTNLPALSYAKLWGASPNDVWIVGQGYAPEYLSYIHHWEGSRWTSTTGLPKGGYLSVWGTASDDVWAVGPDVRHWDGVSWKVVTFQTDVPIRVWSTVTGSGKNDVWLSGFTATSGELRIYQWTGVQWNDLHAKPTGANHLLVRGPNDAYVWNNGGLRHFDGQQWQDVYSDPSANLGEIVLRDGELWQNRLGSLSVWNGKTWIASDRFEQECFQVFATAKDVWVGCSQTGVGILRLRR